MLADPYPVPVWTAPCRGSVTVPGSKSLTNRALVLGALAARRVRLHGALFSRDSRLLVDNLRALGFTVHTDDEACQIEIEGAAGRIPRPEAELFVGNAGTAARFLTALVCLHPDGCYRLDGDEEMRRRPMGGLLDCLQALGAEILFEALPGCFPFQIRTNGLPGGVWKVDASASSQMLSALMMVAPYARSAVTLLAEGARPAFVEMTARLMETFGAQLQGDPLQGYKILPGRPLAPPRADFAIEPDATAGSYFLALPLVVGGSLLVRGMGPHLLQGDTAFGSVLQSLGLKLHARAEGWVAAASGEAPRQPVSFSFQTFSDTFLTLAAIAPLLSAPVTIKGIGHTRFQETDRIHAMRTELARAGAGVDSGEDFLTIHPFATPVAPAARVLVHTYKDHRVAMSMAVLGCHNRSGTGEAWMHIQDPGCCGKTFPEFFEVLENLYSICHDKKLGNG